MKPIRQSFSVAYAYPVHFTEGVFSPSNPLLRGLIAADGGHGPRRLIFAVDANVAKAHPGLSRRIRAYCARPKGLFESPRILLLPGGERSKNEKRVTERILKRISEAGICRHSYVVGVGGGAVLDAAGFAASVAHRGVRFIRIPTTVLAQNDAGIGVKNSVNCFGKKNFLGSFYPPFAVINDSEFLRTLSFRDWRAGLAEALKAGLIKDAAFFNRLCADSKALIRRDLGVMRSVIHRCAQIHLAHIASSDPFEKGSARPLDFGHWSAHKLEQLTGHRVRHGEAVASGMALDSTYSYLAGMLSEAEWKRVIAGIRGFGFKLHHDAFSDRRIYSGLDDFREHLGGKLTLTLLKGIGRGVEVHAMDRKILKRAFALLKRC